jgi:hypothetical protein
MVVVAEVTDVPTLTEEVTAVPPTSTSLPPTIVPSRLVITQSVNGAEIEAFAFGNGPDSVIFVGGIHAGYAPASVNLAEAVIAHFQNNPAAVVAIPANITVYVIPNMNPDAFASASPGDMTKRVNANGVNLNSNWPCNWGAGSQAGSSALSEPESRAVYNFIVAPERNTVATIFWNMPVNESNQRAVSPGECSGGEMGISEYLTNAYANAIGNYTAQQAGDPPGDATNSIANEGIPSIFVLLDNAATANVDEHIPAIEAVLQAYVQN